MSCIRGTNLHPNKDITKQTYLKICDHLSQEFNLKYNTTEFKFMPEAIHEGGIIMSNFPHKTSNMYKSFRHHFLKQWTVVPTNVEEVWKNDNTIIIQKDDIAWTCFKTYSYDDNYEKTPDWTDDDIELFEQCFESFDITCTAAE